MKHQKSDRVYVSAFLTNHVIEHVGPEISLFTLEGAGHGHWDVGPADMIELIADLFVMIQWVGAHRGTYVVETYIILQDGTKLEIRRAPLEVTSPYWVLSYNLPVTGIELPVGLHILWIDVDGAKKCAIAMRVFGDKDPGEPVEPDA